MKEFAKWLMLGGGLIVIAGVIIYFFHDKLKWFGSLPGDIRVERENFRFYMPISSMILVSLILTLLVFLVRKIFNDH